MIWGIGTGIFEKYGWNREKIEKRNQEITKVQKRYRFTDIINLNIPTTKVDEYTFGNLVELVSKTLVEIKPNILFLPYVNDIHTDHKSLVKAFLSCTKWFRYPYIDTVLYYETLSETNFNINPTDKKFIPNIYINIEGYLKKKVDIMKIYESELKEFPFPRSEKAIKSLAWLRGSEAGFSEAEAFQLIMSRRTI